MESPATQPSTSALTIYRPLVEKVVAALGALVTHQLAYAAASLAGLKITSATDHGHLSFQWAVITPLAVAAMVGFVIWQLKGLGFRSSLSVRYLSSLVAGFFLIQEFAEGLLGGQSVAEVAAHPAILIGVFVAPLVAFVLSRALASVTELAARLLARPGFAGPPAQPILIPIPVRCSPGRAGSPSRPRAPPSRLRT